MVIVNLKLCCQMFEINASFQQINNAHCNASITFDTVSHANDDLWFFKRLVQ